MISQDRSWYMKFATGVFLAHLLIGIVNGEDAVLRMVLKAIQTALLTTALMWLWYRRKRSGPKPDRN